MKKIALLCATTAFVMPGMAFAQSTGTIATEEETNVVVTGTRHANVNGISVPDTSKAQGVLGQELIARQTPGQSILQTVNLVPGVNFTNSDPYRLVGRQPPHPRLRRQPHLGDLRRHSAERYGQLRDLLEPAARSGADRPGHRQPRLRPTSTARPPRRPAAPSTIARSCQVVTSASAAPARSATSIISAATSSCTAANGGRTARALSSPIRTRATICSAAPARSTSSSSTPASTMRSATTATSCRSPAITTAIATISTATRRSTICAPPSSRLASSPARPASSAPGAWRRHRQPRPR